MAASDSRGSGINPPIHERSDEDLLELKALSQSPASLDTISLHPYLALGFLVALVDEIIRLRGELKNAPTS